MRATAILIFDKSLYLRGRLRLTTARRLSAYMSSRALVTTTASSLCCFFCVYIGTHTHTHTDNVVIIIIRDYFYYYYSYYYYYTGVNVREWRLF